MNLLSNLKTEYSPSTWMTDLSYFLAPLKLHLLSLPSTHNSGIDKKAVSGIEEGWTACQNDTFLFQLLQGARVLDIRLKHGIEGIFFSHNGALSKRTISRLIDDCNNFFRQDYATKKNEIVILNFHDFDSFTERDYLDVFQQLINGFTGTNGTVKILPRAARHLTLAEIQSNYPGCNIIIAAYQFGIHPECWNNIPHYKIGKEAPSINELDAFIDKHTIELYKPDMWSLQVINTSTTYGPLNLSGYTNNKLQPDKKTLIHSNIVNVDFFEKTPIVFFCIQANIHKGERALDKTPPSPPEFDHAFYVRPWMTCFFSFKESTDNYAVTHHTYTIDDGQEVKIENQYTELQKIELKLMPDTCYKLKVYGVDFAGNYSAPLIHTLRTSDPLTVEEKPVTPGITGTQRYDKFACAIYWAQGQRVDCFEVQVFEEMGIVDGVPIREPLQTKIVSRWANGTYFENLPSYDAYQIAVRAINSYEIYGDYSIRRVEAYRPITSPPTAPSKLQYTYNPVTQTVYISYIEGEARSGTVFHTLLIETRIELHQETIYGSNFTFPLPLSLDFTLTLYCTDQDNNQSTAVYLTGNTRENGGYTPEPIGYQKVTRESLTSGSTTWSGSRDIVKYKIHLYDTQDVEDGTANREGTIIGPPINEVFYSGSELKYTFYDLTPQKPYHVFVWGVNAYGTEGWRSYTNNTFMHAEHNSDQENPTPPLHLTATYSTRNGNLLVFFNLSSDNVGIDHYIVNINGVETRKIAYPLLRFHTLTHPLKKNIPYTVSVYAVDMSGNRSSTVDVSGDTSDKDTQNLPPTNSYVGLAQRKDDNTAQLTWTYIHHARYIIVMYYLVKENEEIQLPLIHIPGHFTGVDLRNIQPDKKYKVAVVGVNSYGALGQPRFITF